MWVCTYACKVSEGDPLKLESHRWERDPLKLESRVALRCPGDCWKQNSSPLQELQVLLINVPSLQPFVRLFLSKQQEN